MFTFLILLAIYMMVLMIISWQAGKNETKEDFLIAGRNRSWWQVGASKYAASIGAGWFIAYSGFAYEFGFPVFLIFGGAAGGVLLYAYWATPRIYESSSKAYTLGDYVENCTSSQGARNFSHYTALCMLVLNLLIAIVGGATLLHVFNIFSYEIGVLVMLVSVVSYMLLAGFKAVMLTDVVRGH